MRTLGYFHTTDAERTDIDFIEKQFEEYCRLNLHRLVDTFVSTSGRAGLGTSEFQRMSGCIELSGGGFLVIIPDASHLGYDLESVARAILKLDQLDSKVVCCDEEFPDPIQNAFQTFGVKGVSRTRSRRIRDAMRARALKGQAMGRPPFGYTIGSDGMLQVDSKEAPVVELIYRLYTQDELGFRLIAQHLNEREIATRRNGNWSVVSVRDILRNTTYTGTYSRLGMRRAKMHDAIIPPEVFRAAQDLVKSRRPIGRIAKYEPFLLSGLLYCGYCGNKMIGVTRRQAWKGKDGKRTSRSYRYYQCQSKNNQSTCGYHTWRTSKLEAAVLDQIKYVLESDVCESSPKGSKNSTGKYGLDIKEQRIKNAERQFVQSLRRVARGDVRVTILDEYIKELDASRKAASHQETDVDVGLILDGWVSLDFETQKKFLFDHITKINVEDDRVQVVA